MQLTSFINQAAYVRYNIFTAERTLHLNNRDVKYYIVVRTFYDTRATVLANSVAIYGNEFTYKRKQQVWSPVNGAEAAYKYIYFTPLMPEPRMCAIIIP